MTPSPALPREGQPGLPGQVRDHLVSPVPCLRPSVSEACFAPDAWRPIESAPKDGTHILVSWPMRVMDDDGAPNGAITRRDTLVTWMNGGAWIEPDYLGASGEWFGDEDSYAADPDLWMPLPAPPRRDAADTEPHGPNDMKPDSAPGESADPQSQGDTQ